MTEAVRRGLNKARIWSLKVSEGRHRFAQVLVGLAFGVSALFAADFVDAKRSSTSRAERLAPLGSHERRLQETYQHRKELESRGIAHFEQFDAFAEQHARSVLDRQATAKVPQGSKSAGASSPYLQTYITIGRNIWLDGRGSLPVRFTRLLPDGTLESATTLAEPFSDARDAYVRAFTQEGVDASSAATAFDRTPIIIESTLFQNPLRLARRDGEPLFLTLELPLSNAMVQVRWRSEKPAPAAEDDLYRLHFFRTRPAGGHRETAAFLYMGKPSLLSLPPPERFAKHFAQLQQQAFSRQDFSVVLLEGETATRNTLLAARSQGRIHVAADLTRSGQNSHDHLQRLERAFAVRTGKTIAVVGHYEASAEAFAIRPDGRKTVTLIPRETLLALGKKYDINVLMIGCSTAAGRPDAALLTVTDINSWVAVRSLVDSAAKASNWAEFFAAMSSSDRPILVGTWNERGSETHLPWFRTNADGDVHVIASIWYRLRCATIKSC